MKITDNLCDFHWYKDTYEWQKKLQLVVIRLVKIE